MPSPTTRRATSANSQEETSQRLLAGTIDQTLFWKDLRQGVLFVVAFVTLGGGAVLFLTMPRHVQGMIIYGAILMGCVLMILAGLRRRTHGR